MCIPQVDWSAASEKSYPESEDRADNMPRQGDLNHEGILCNSGWRFYLHPGVMPYAVKLRAFPWGISL